MAVYKNYYNRRPVCLALTVYCLFLLCSTHCMAMDKDSGRVRHRHTRPEEVEYYRSQVEKTVVEESSKNPILTCPNCLYKLEKSLKPEPDSLRLEAIKRQILSKLGMRHKPNVTHSLPREVIMETLFRAEESGGFLGNYQTDEEDISTTSAKSASSFETVDVDDFYGRTSEIISFAEEGETMNGNKLLEFRISTESGQAGQELKVRAATLWLRADVDDTPSKRYPPLMGRPTLDCQPTLWVFKVKHSVRNGTLTTKEFSDLTEMSAYQTIDTTMSNWQKFDLTGTVREWYVESSGGTSRLRLLVDCSGCCRNLNVHLFNSHRDRKNDPNRPFLVIHTDPNSAKRVRRRALDCSQDSGNQCCKQRFYVSFKQLGWEDWVIAPHGYYANYCRGDCGHHRTPDTYVTYHTHVIEEMRKTHHLSGMQPCCAPLKFSSMSLIYFGPDSNIIKRDLPKMVVDECGCP